MASKTSLKAKGGGAARRDAAMKRAFFQTEYQAPSLDLSPALRFAMPPNKMTTRRPTPQIENPLKRLHAGDAAVAAGVGLLHSAVAPQVDDEGAAAGREPHPGVVAGDEAAVPGGDDARHDGDLAPLILGDAELVENGGDLTQAARLRSRGLP